MTTVRGRRRVVVTLPALLLCLGVGTVAEGQRPPGPPRTFESLLKEIASAPGDPCNYQTPDFQDRSELERSIFDAADKAVVAKLNEPPRATPSGAKTRATEALQDLERRSAEINRSWPEERRFHFETLELPPALVVKLMLRTRWTFSFYAPGPGGDDPMGSWRVIGAPDDGRYSSAPSVWVGLFPLARGPSQAVRFLATFGSAGCAGASGGLSYYAYEWDPESSTLDEFIRIEGAHNIASLAEARTEGSVIRLPYCWFSAVDTWDNPELCAVDSYDLSGDRVRFVGRDYNLPDLAALAKAIEYAKARDYPATLAYCGSADVARRMVRDLPPFLGIPAFDKDPDFPAKRISASKESVDFGDFHFELEKRGDRWLVVSFRVK